MKITAAKSDLEPALALVAAGMNDKGGDISSHYLFRPHNNGVEVLAWNGRIGAAATFVGQIENADDGMFTVEGWRLRQWVSAAGDVVISMSESEGKVSVKSPKSRGTFRSLDPDNFQFWDDTYKSATSVSKLSAKALRDALSNARNFVYEKDTQFPAYSLTEARGGVVLASDRQALSVSVVPGLHKDSAFRIHHKDIPVVISFLANAGDEEIELLEHDHALFVRIGEDKVLTVGKPNTEFPSIKYDLGDRDPIQWTVDKNEVLAGIQQLSASAEKSDIKLRFKFDPKKKSVTMSMKSMEGTDDTVPLETTDVAEDMDFLNSKIREIMATVHKDKIAGMDETEANDFLDQEAAKGTEMARKVFFDKGCLVNYAHLKKVMGGYDGDKVQFGVSPMGKGGFIRFKNIRGTEELNAADNEGNPVSKTIEVDVFLTMLAFIRDLSK